MKSLISGLLFLNLVTFSLSAQTTSLESIQAIQQGKLEQALKKLNAQRDQIQSEQLPLSKAFNNLESRAKALRKEVNEIRNINDSKSIQLDTLTQQVNNIQKEYDYINLTLWNEYFASYNASLSAGELATFGENVRKYNLQIETGNLTKAEQLKKSLALLTNSITRIESVLGAKKYSGEALDNEGILTTGTFLQVGPCLYFTSDDKQSVGLVTESKSLQPKIHPFEGANKKSLLNVFSENKGELPIDISLGNALAFASIEESFSEHLHKGGIWVYPIVAFAILSTVIAIFKMIQIFSIKHPHSTVIKKLTSLLNKKQKEEALNLAKSQPQPSSEMLTTAIENVDQSLDLVEEVMYESMLGTQPRLERFLNIIAITAAVAPLLGLLGTVTGIIKTFKLMNVFGAGDPKPLISGISEALITTELGLILAIPALIMHALLSRKVSGIMSQLEKMAISLINGLSRDQKVKPDNSKSSEHA